MTTRIIVTHWSKHQTDLINIRTEVFVQEQQVPAAEELDGLDEQATHFLALSPTGEALGCARLLQETDNQQDRYHIGRVAVLKPFRNQGVGFALMRFVLDYCQSTAPETGIYLHAQIQRRGFYEALGFVGEGEEFMDAGIAHVCMNFAKSLERHHG